MNTPTAPTSQVPVARARGRLAVAGALATMLITAVAALAVVPDVSAQQADTDATVRITARRLDNGKVEFALQQRTHNTWGARQLPQPRFFPTNAPTGRWLNSGPLTIGGHSVRITARRLDDGKVEFALQQRTHNTWGARQLPRPRFFPTNAPTGRWLNSGPLTIGADSPPSTTTTTGRTATGTGGGLPFTHVLQDGSTFTLNPRIAEKIRNGREINYVFSYQSSGIPIFSDQYEAGFRATQAEAGRIHPMSFTAVAPAESPFDHHMQISQIESLHARDQIDCLSIQPADSTGFTELTNRLLSQGIPVFTVGVTTDGNELTNFAQGHHESGRQAADVALAFMRRNDLDWDTFALSGGDPRQPWAQGRMRGFHDRILEVLPEADFLTTPENGIQVGGGGYIPSISYDDYRRILVDNPELDFILNVDVGAEHANRAIVDTGREGKVFTIGWNVSYGQLDGVERGIQVAVLDQQWAEQAGFGSIACAELFANGRILPNTQTLRPIGKDQVAAARRELDRILGSG